MYLNGVKLKWFIRNFFYSSCSFFDVVVVGKVDYCTTLFWVQLNKIKYDNITRSLALVWLKKKYVYGANFIWIKMKTWFIYIFLVWVSKMMKYYQNEYLLLYFWNWRCSSYCCCALFGLVSSPLLFFYC